MPISNLRMMDISVKKIIHTLIINFCICLIHGQEKKDTLVDWKMKFAVLGGIPKMSPGGKWIAVSRFLKTGSDSTFVLATDNRKKVIHRLLGSPVFLNDDTVLSTSKGSTYVLDLRSSIQASHDNVLQVYILPKFDRYALLCKDRKVSIYDLGGKISEMTDVYGMPVSDSRGKLIVKRKVSENWELTDISGAEPQRIYSSENEIRKFEMNVASDKLFITETVKERVTDQLVVISTKTKKKLIELSIPKMSDTGFTEIQNGKAYLLSAHIKLPIAQDSDSTVVDIWYGNDPFLGRDKFLLKSKIKKFWKWIPAQKNVQEINVSKGMEIQSLNNWRYFMAYLPRKNFNYLTTSLTPADLNDVVIIDTEKGTNTEIGSFKAMKRQNRGKVLKPISEQVICSPDGKRFLASTNGQKWSLFKVSGELEAVISNHGLELPIFSGNRNELYFESADDLFHYDIGTNKIKALGIAKGKITRIKSNINRTVSGPVATVSLKEPILLEAYEPERNTTTYYLLENRGMKAVIPTTENRITQIVYDKQMKNFWTLEQHYNKPPALYRYGMHQPAQSFFDGNIKDIGTEKIRQEINSFDAAGHHLQGILYYPKNFDPALKYPMVVHIYQRQRQDSNEYLSPNNEMPVGFQIRTLIEKDYFVYLPDILYGPSGPGVSALECVNKALDGLTENPNIDMTKVGLEIGRAHV